MKTKNSLYVYVNSFISTIGGVIINISSIHDAVPRKGLIHYCSAKAELKMFSKCLSLEIAEDNIRVVSVAPGAIETEMNREEIVKFGRDKFDNWIPSGRIGSVTEVARSVAFLASDMASVKSIVIWRK